MSAWRHFSDDSIAREVCGVHLRHRRYITTRAQRQDLVLPEHPRTPGCGSRVEGLASGCAPPVDLEKALPELDLERSCPAEVAAGRK